VRLGLALAAMAVLARAGAAEESTERYRSMDSREEAGPHYQRALDLYAKGVGAAPAIIAELDLEIADHPQSMQARILKARVLKGTDRCEEALVVLDDADAIADAGEFISGGAKFLRAECLYYGKRFAESKAILTTYGAFMTTSPAGRNRYDELRTMVDEALAAGH
jgi:hypothetical protein